MVAALVRADEPGGRREHGREPLAVREGHRVVVARVREQHARQAARGSDQVEAREERPQRGRIEAAEYSRPVARPARSPGRARTRPARRAANRRRPGRAARASGRTPGRARAASSSMHPPMLAPRAASHAAPDSREQPLAGGDGVPPAVRPHLAVALAVATEVERQRGQPRGRRLLAHQLVVLLAAARAVAHGQGASRPAGRAEEPAGQPDAVRGDRDRLGRPCRRGRRPARPVPAPERRMGEGTSSSRPSLANGYGVMYYPPLFRRRSHARSERRPQVAGRLQKHRPQGTDDRIDELGERLAAARVLHVNATAFGGGVAELLYTLVPLLSTSAWRPTGRSSRRRGVLQRDEELPQRPAGPRRRAPGQSRALYEGSPAENAAELTTALRLRRRPRSRSRSALRDFVTRNQDRSRLDLALPHRHLDAGPELCDYLLPSFDRYDAAVFTLADLCPRGSPSRCVDIAPAIDPRRPKNMTLSPEDAATSCAGSGSTWSGRSCSRSRASTPGRTRWVSIDVYRAVKARFPTPARAASAPWPATTPRAGTTSSAIIAYAGGDPDVFILSNLNGVGYLEVNAFQSARRRGPAEVPARRLRADRRRGAVEGPPGRRRQRRRHPAADRGRRHRLPRQLGRGVAERCLRVMDDPSRHHGWRCSARRRCAASSSRRACARRPAALRRSGCFTYFGGSQYINSTATGNYEDYLTDEIVSFVDENFRTIKGRDSRAVMGKSSGGYGSLIMGLRHADLFGLVCSTAGDAYFEYCYPTDFAKAFRLIKGDPMGFMKRFWATEKHGKDDHAAINTIGMAACYSPNGRDFDMPFDLKTGEIRMEVWERWLEHDPVRLVENSVENLKSLKLLYLDAGTRDEFALDVGARILSSKLSGLGVEHVHEEFDDGHFSISYRYDRSLELISETILHHKDREI